MRRVVFKSLKILDQTTTSKYVGGGAARYTTNITYDMGSVRTHVLQLTHRDRLKSPSTWAFAVLVGILIGMILMSWGVYWLVPSNSFRDWPLAVLCVVVGCGLAYFLSALFSPRRFMVKLARKERGCARNEKIACVLEQNWPEFLSRLSPKDRERLLSLDLRSKLPYGGSDRASSRVLGIVLIVAGMAGVAASIVWIMEPRSPFHKYDEKSTYIEQVTRGGSAVSSRKVSGEQLNREGEASQSGRGVLTLLFCLIVTGVGILKSRLWPVRDIPAKASTLGLADDTKQEIPRLRP